MAFVGVTVVRDLMCFFFFCVSGCGTWCNTFFISLSCPEVSLFLEICNQLPQSSHVLTKWKDIRFVCIHTIENIDQNDGLERPIQRGFVCVEKKRKKWEEFCCQCFSLSRASLFIHYFLIGLWAHPKLNAELWETVLRSPLFSMDFGKQAEDTGKSMKQQQWPLYNSTIRFIRLRIMFFSQPQFVGFM